MIGGLSSNLSEEQERGSTCPRMNRTKVYGFLSRKALETPAKLSQTSTPRCGEKNAVPTNTVTCARSFESLYKSRHRPNL